MTKKAKLNRIIECCEAHYGRGLAINWKNGDFVDLSREIFKSTKVNISPSTLKRIFGKVSVEDDYIPQQATLNALINYGGYIDDSFLKSGNSDVDEDLPQQPKKNSQKISVYLFSLIAVSITLILIWFFVYRSNPSGSVKLLTTEGILPSSAYFELVVPDTKDSVLIDFGDKSTLILVKPEQKKIAHNYFIPGVFDVLMYNRGKVISKTKVSVKSNKWIGLGFRRQRELPEHYYAFPANKTGKDSLFYIANTQLKKLGIDTTGSLFTRLSNYTDVGSSADDFIFETSFKNKVKTGGIYCHATQVKIAGMNGMVRFRFVNPGCSSKSNIVLSEKRYEGLVENLSSLLLDLAQWNNVKAINKNKQVSLYVNEKLVFRAEYAKSLGELKGVFVEFEGNGFVKTCKLTDLNGKTFFQF